MACGHEVRRHGLPKQCPFGLPSSQRALWRSAARPLAAAFMPRRRPTTC